MIYTSYIHDSLSHQGSLIIKFSLCVVSFHFLCLLPDQKQPATITDAYPDQNLRALLCCCLMIKI